MVGTAWLQAYVYGISNISTWETLDGKRKTALERYFAVLFMKNSENCRIRENFWR